MLKYIFIILIAALGFGSLPVKAQQSNAGFPPVKIKDNHLVLNDGTDRKFFLSGMVYNWPSSGEELSRYDHTKMENMMKELVAIHCNAMRWNAFLKGVDFTYDANHNISGLKDGCLDALKDGMDLAYKYGIMMQIVLSTAHFQEYGAGGKDGKQGGIRNGDRVAYLGQMFSTDAGIQAYIQNVMVPICQRLGKHPALVGYLLINEAYGMTDPRDTPRGSWSDEYVRLANLQKWANHVAGTIHRLQPGALCSVSGISRLKTQYEDDALIAAGGDPLGTMDLDQFQYYPADHIIYYSPFRYTPYDMVKLWGGSRIKAAIAGEFPVEGLKKTDKNPFPMTPTEAYEALWNLDYSGGFTWSNLVYDHSSPSQKQSIDDGYITFYNKHLKGYEGDSSVNTR